MQQAQWGQLFRQGVLSVLMTRIAYFFYQITFYFYLIISQYLCDIPNNDLGAFLSVEFFILVIIDIISYLFILL